MRVNTLSESWFANELIPVLQDYADAGAVSLKDFVRMAARSRETTIADYLKDISSREWAELQRYIESVKNEKTMSVNVTPGMARSMGRGTVKATCSSCGMVIPKYIGGYPKACPSCGEPIDYTGVQEEDVSVYTELVNSNSYASYLGSIGNKTFVAFDNRVYAFVPKLNEDIDSTICSLVEGATIDILDYVAKHAVQVSLNRSPSSVEDRIVDNRVRVLLAEQVSIEGFWGSTEGKQLRKEREQVIEKIKDDKEKKKLGQSYYAALLEINRLDLLDNLINIKYDEDIYVTTVQLAGISEMEKLKKVTEAISKKFDNTEMVSPKKEGEDYLIIVY